MTLIVGRPQHEVEQRAALIRAAFKPDHELRERLYNEQSALCAVCIQNLQHWDAPVSELDHATPVIHLASSNETIEDAIRLANQPGNIILVHSSCNAAKNAYDLEDLHRGIHSGEIALAEPKYFAPEEIERMKMQLSERGRIQGRKNVESGQLASVRTPESCAKGGRIGGRKNVESGHMQAIGRIYGRIQGHKNVESGQLASIQSLGGRISGRIQGRKNVESGHLTSIASMGGRIGGCRNVESGQLASICVEGGRAASLINNHKRWHINRGISKPETCALCKAVHCM